jgi:hypothetical protein
MYLTPPTEMKSREVGATWLSDYRARSVWPGLQKEELSESSLHQPVEKLDEEKPGETMKGGSSRRPRDMVGPKGR